ncbi:MAG: hypothetical protein JSU70_22905 [Phycisphaerales bacterium]|nr:MAG: hypothetical protein JSU70_22905 [Phycisphaerales bacterium]
MRDITRRRLASLVASILVLVVAGHCSGATAEWDGGGGDLLWSNPDNWFPDVLPTSDDAAVIDIPDANCLIDEATSAECGTLYVSRNSAPCYLNMTGGTLTSGGHIRVGEPSDSNGVFHMSGGSVSTSGNGRLWIGINGNGTVIITGGEMTASDKLECGKNSSGIGYIYVHGGTLNVDGYGSDDFEIGKYGTGIVTITGGVINVEDNIKLAQESTGIGRLYLYGGTITAGNLRDPADGIRGDLLIDITEGTLILPEDYSEIVNEYISNGWIVAHGGLGKVVVEYDAGTDQTYVTAGLADPELAWNPSPSNYSTVPWTMTGPTLTWKSGEYAVSHDVYFGTDKDDVNDADNTPGLWTVFKGNQNPESYNPGMLDLGQTYYWRIDEFNDNAWAPAGSPWKGTVWEFTVADYAVVDDMDSYGDAATPGPPPPPGSRMWYTWKDGAGWTQPSVVAGNGSGSVVDPNTGIVHGGGQSLKLIYDNDGTNVFGDDTALYSEIRADTSHLVIGSDWAAAGVKALVVWFYGDPDNDANATEQMYVKLNGVRIPYSGDMDDIKEAEWHEWNIDLAAFGVSLTNVNMLAIGFGNEGSATPGGDGFVYFDDLRLYPARCLISLLQPEADLDDDCDVDHDDLGIMAGDWLDGDYLAVGSDGVLENFAGDDSQWVNDPVRGGTLWLDGVDDWVDINDTEFSNFHDKTISLWLKIREFPESDPYIFCFRDEDDVPHPYRIYFRTHGLSSVRVQFIGTASEDYSPDYIGAVPNTWHHLAFVLRDTGTDTCNGEFYADGTLIHEFVDRPRHYGSARSVNLGSWNAGNSPFMPGSFDEFRVYDYALSAAEIKFLAGVAGGVEPTDKMLVYYDFDDVSGLAAHNSSTYVFDRPLLTAAELYGAEAEGSRTVNFMDFAVLAETWLEQQLWPGP